MATISSSRADERVNCANRPWRPCRDDSLLAFLRGGTLFSIERRTGRLNRERIASSSPSVSTLPLDDDVQPTSPVTPSPPLFTGAALRNIDTLPFYSHSHVRRIALAHCHTSRRPVLEALESNLVVVPPYFIRRAFCRASRTSVRERETQREGFSGGEAERSVSPRNASRRDARSDASHRLLPPFHPLFTVRTTHAHTGNQHLYFVTDDSLV